MKRTNISKRIEADTMIVEFAEEYQAGSITKVKSHILNEFITSDAGLKNRTVISSVEVHGFFEDPFWRFFYPEPLRRQKYLKAL